MILLSSLLETTAISLIPHSNLDRANIWMTNNGLKLNANKTKCMLIHSARTRVQPPPLDIHLSGSQIEQVSRFKLLGVVDTLTWTDHISHVVTKVSRNVNLLRRLSWFLPQPLLVLFLKSYILPLVDYCDVVWDNCTRHDSSRLQSLFNYACRLVLHRPRLSPPRSWSLFTQSPKEAPPS